MCSSRQVVLAEPLPTDGFHFLSIWKHMNLKSWQDVNELCTQVVERTHHLIEKCKLANVPKIVSCCHHSHVDNVDFMLDSKTISDPYHINRVDVTEFGYFIIINFLEISKCT